MVHVFIRPYTGSFTCRKGKINNYTLQNVKMNMIKAFWWRFGSTSYSETKKESCLTGLRKNYHKKK